MRARLLGMLALSPGSVTSPGSREATRRFAATTVLRSPPRSPDDLISASDLLGSRPERVATRHIAVSEREGAEQGDDGSKSVTNAQDAGRDAAIDGEEMVTCTRKPIVKVKVSKRKKRVSKGGTGGDQGTIKGTKVTKPRAKDTDKKIDEPLGLDSAVPRRLDWTPPRTRVVDLTNGSDASTQEHSSTTSLQGILGSFGFTPNHSFSSNDSRPHPNAGQQPPLKRRRLDLVESVASTKVAAVKKKVPRIKAPKKKAQTITELATRDYLPVNNNSKSSLMEGFLSQLPSKDAGQNDDAKLASVIESTRGQESARTGTKKGQSSKSRLLSPEKAIVAAESQELLFGTSSQLVREDSPSFIRDLQYALRESEASASQEEPVVMDQNLWSAATRNLDGSLLEAETVDLTKSTRPVSVRYSSNQGAFHTTPTLLVPQQQSLQPDPGPSNEESPHFSAIGGASPAVTIEEDRRISLPKSLAEAACRARPRSKSPVKKKGGTRTSVGDTGDGKVDFNTWTVAELSKKIKAYGFKPVKKKAAMVELLEKCMASMGDPALRTSEANGEGIPSNSKADESKGSRKRRSPKEKPKSTKAPKAAEKSLAGSPKKRGRPKKTDAKIQEQPSKPKAVQSARSAAPSLEALPDVILVTSSPPDQPAATTSHPAPISGKNRAADCSAAASGDIVSATSRDSQAGLEATAPRPAPASTALSAAPAATPQDPNARLLDAITEAVTAFPPTHDPRRPTWHEKMLMYDPIVLEDLAVWLNTEGLGRVGVDEEVWPALVRQWCEERSICCLWRENLRGGKRSRY